MDTPTAAVKVEEALSSSMKPADIVFMFGSVATGYDDDEAEKNLVLIGDGIDEEAVNKELAPIRDEIKPSLVVNIFSGERFAREFLSGKIFIRKSANAPKTFLKGGDMDLWRLYYEAE
jgi:hypothetical protein